MKIKCKCGYEWGTKSKLRMVTCPNCQLKVNLKGELKEDNKSETAVETSDASKDLNTEEVFY